MLVVNEGERLRETSQTRLKCLHPCRLCPSVQNKGKLVPLIRPPAVIESANWLVGDEVEIIYFFDSFEQRFNYSCLYDISIY